MDILDIIWQCYDFGIYTPEIAHTIAQSVNIEAVQFNPDAVLEDVCYEIYVNVIGDE